MKVERAVLSVDGNCGCALLGENLQEGEAEFVEIDSPIQPGTDEWPRRYFYRLWEDAAARACGIAYRRLRERLPGRVISYALDSSHPRAC